MDAVGPLVNRQDPRIPVQLTGARVLDKAHAAVDLHIGRRDLDAAVGVIGFDHRDQQFGHRLGGGGAFRVRVGGAAVQFGGGQIGQRAHRFDMGAHVHQHAPHVGMLNDRHGAGAALDGAALHPVLGVLGGLLIGPVGDRDTLQANHQAGIVHHDEHVLEALVLLADEIADGAFVIAIGHHAGGRTMNADLTFQRHRPEVVAAAEAAVRVDQEFRHQVQRQTFWARWAVGRARQHQMNDVLAHIVLAIGDVNLLTLDQVMVALALGFSADRAKIGAGLWLGQVHGAGPFAGDHALQINLLLFWRAAAFQDIGRALIQQRAQREGHIGGVPHLAGRHL